MSVIFQPLFWIIMLATAVIFGPGLYATFSRSPFVPSQRKMVREMIRLARLRPDDVAYELGSGSGTILFAIRGVVKATGIEISIPLAIYTKLRALFRANTHVVWGSFFGRNYADATVIFTYLGTNAMQRIATEIWPQLKPGARIVSSTFELPGVTPTETSGKIYVYTK